MPPFLLALLGQGLSLTANAVLAKGKEWVKEKTGIDVTSSSLSAEQLTQIKQWELENEVELQKLRIEDNKLDVEMFRIQTADVASARQREVDILKADPTRPWWMPSITSVLAFVVVFGGGVMFALIEDTEARYAIIGAITLVLGYYFGSTKNAADRAAQTTKLVDKIAGDAK